MEQSRQTPGLMTNSITALLWLIIFIAFVALRFDTSERTYFQVDDQVVVWLIDDAVNKNNWQPDWYRAAQHHEKSDYFAAEAKRNDLPHDHHYNFTAHILLSAAIINPLRALGCDIPTITLLHHIALGWDTLSLLLLIIAATRLGGQSLALCAGVIYTVLPLAVQGSHYARPDALLTAMGSAILFLTLQKNTLSHWRWLAANGLVLGIAIGGKASQLMLGIFPALTYALPLLDKKTWNAKSISAVALDGAIVCALISITLGLMFFIGDITLKDFVISVQSVQLYYQHPAPPDILEQYHYRTQLLNILQYFLSTLGWPLLLAMAIGCTTLARKKDKLPLLAMTLPLLFFILYFASVPAFFDRSFCALSAAIVLLAATGIHCLLTTIHAALIRNLFAVTVAVMACWTPITIQYHLQTDHLRSHHNDDRLTFQKNLQTEQSEKSGKNYWFKNIDRSDMFSQTIPKKPANNPRIYVAEDLNDWNSRIYLQKLRDNGFVQIAEFDGDFADMPTNSLITVHEAAHFYYLIRMEEQ
ncbi:MAG TPA: glycosyltransferase family 39 protein [Pseudomonadales bacterium]|nr:glycosyltransferase family 39 protein [Pseudomonadales bacterium]